MATITASTEIDRSIEEVFAVIADSRNDPLWCRTVLECAQTEGDGPGPEARYRAVHKPGPKASELRIDVLDFEPPKRITWRQVDDAGTFVVTMELEPVGASRTRLTQTDQTSWNGIFRLLSPVLHLVVRRTLPKQFDSLRAHLENAAG